MKIISLERGKTTQLFYAVVILLSIVILLTAKQEDMTVVVGGIFVVFASVFPLYLWLVGKSHGLPIWPTFTIATGVTAALPMTQDSTNLIDYTSAEILTGAYTLIGFMIIGTIVWLGLTIRRSPPPKRVFMISSKRAEGYLFAFVVFGILFYFNGIGNGFLPLPGNSMQIVRGVVLSLSSLGIFVLAFYDGRGLLAPWQSTWLVILLVLLVFGAGISLIMATAVVPVAMLLMGYALGSGKIPWKSLTVAVVFAAILHPGKFMMRELYWGENALPLTYGTLPTFYSDWFGYGFEQVSAMVGLNPDIIEEDRSSTLFERTGSLHMLLLVQRKTPHEIPYLGGITYTPILRLMVPRFLDEKKGISHVGNIILSVNYGLQTLEQTAFTSIAWGLVPEAYANFGYVGVGILAVVLAVFYSFITNLTVGVPMTSLRFVLGLLVLAAATHADTMGIFVTSQFQGVIGVTLAALILMREQPNPLATEKGEETIGKDRAMVRRRKTWLKESRQTAHPPATKQILDKSKGA